VLARLVPRLRRYARALLRSPQSADEVVLETLERAAREGHSYGDDRGSRTRLFTLMHAVYRDRLHGAASEREAGSSGEHDFERLIALLPPEQREVFLLVTLEEMSYEEVAKTLGIPAGTVMSRLSRARERLRTALGVPAVGRSD